MAISVCRRTKNASLRRPRWKRLWSEQLNAKVSTSNERIHSMKQRDMDSSIVRKWACDVFRSIPQDAPLVVAEAVWQYSQHLLGGLISHHGPILTVANWSGTWPGLVGLLNLNGSLTKAGVKYSTLWSEEFTDKFFTKKLREWLNDGKVKTRHLARPEIQGCQGTRFVPQSGEKIARRLLSGKAIMGIFDEGCMGMYNAIIPDELLHPTGVYKERLSQSTLYAKMLTVSDEEARKIYDWLLSRGSEVPFRAE